MQQRADPDSGAPLIMLTVEQVAAALNLGRATVQRLIQRGELLAVRIGRARRVPIECLEAFTRARIAEAQAEIHSYAPRAVRVRSVKARRQRAIVAPRAERRRSRKERTG